MKFSNKIIILCILSVIIAVIFCIWLYGRYLCKGMDNPDPNSGSNSVLGISWDEYTCSKGATSYFEYGLRKLTDQK